MMPAYCDVDGLPCHASEELLTTILRREWGFDGIVASDYTAVQMLVGQHRLTDDLGTAASMALRAGMDSELPTSAGYAEPLKAAIADGRIDTGLRRPRRRAQPAAQVPARAVRAAVRRRAVASRSSTRSEAEEQSLAVDLVRRSIVLLENDGVLPLADATGASP